MKTIRNTYRVSIFVASLLSSIAAEPSGETKLTSTGTGGTEPKTHTLFMGADLSLGRNGKLYKVKDVTGSSFVIDVNGEKISVRSTERPINLKVASALKLTTVSATLDKLTTERAYTPENDPRKQRMKQQLDAMNNSIVAAESATREAGKAEGALGQIRTAPPGFVNPGAIAAAQSASIEAETIMNMKIAAANSEQFSAGHFARRAQEDLDEENFDAVEVTFQLSSESPLNNPFVLLLVRFSERNSKPGVFQNWIYAESVDAIGTEARRVHIKQGGFPIGFTIEDCQVRLYNHGEEVATNVAPKRVLLTATEAFQYILIEYLAIHKGDTLDPVPAMGTLPAGFRTRLASGGLNDKVFVRVTKDGRPEGAYADAACATKIDDPYLAGIVDGIRFKPALRKGEPIDGIVPLTLGKLSI